jgi:hypothetical protein
LTRKLRLSTVMVEFVAGSRIIWSSCGRLSLPLDVIFATSFALGAPDRPGLYPRLKAGLPQQGDRVLRSCDSDPYAYELWMGGIRLGVSLITKHITGMSDLCV